MPENNKFDTTSLPFHPFKSIPGINAGAMDISMKFTLKTGTNLSDVTLPNF